MGNFTLGDLEAIVRERGTSGAADSWTAKLFAGGQEKAAKKLGEEAVETVIAAIADHREGLIGESADLLYHLVVVLALGGVSVDEVLEELQRRTARSGIAEKAARPGS